jgi:hypothetical protein
MLKPPLSSHWRYSIAVLDAGVRAMVLTCLVLAAISVSGMTSKPAHAQQQTVPLLAQSLPHVEQILLAEKHIQGMIAASKDMRVITDNAPEDIDKLTPKTVALLDAVARKNGLNSYEEYKSVGDNVGLVLGGYDEVTRKYVGKSALIKLRIARVQADKKMSAEDKQEALGDFDLDRQLPLPPVENKNNIALVLKYADRLSASAD